MEEFKLIVKQDCPYYPSEELRFSVVKVQHDLTEELVECCLTKVEAEALVDKQVKQVASLYTPATEADIAAWKAARSKQQITQGFNW